MVQYFMDRSLLLAYAHRSRQNRLFFSFLILLLFGTKIRRGAGFLHEIRTLPLSYPDNDNLITSALIAVISVASASASAAAVLLPRLNPTSTGLMVALHGIEAFETRLLSRPGDDEDFGHKGGEVFLLVDFRGGAASTPILIEMLSFSMAPFGRTDGVRVLKHELSKFPARHLLCAQDKLD